MEPFKLEDIPLKDLHALGLHDGKQYLLDRQSQEALLTGNLTKFMNFRDLNIDGAQKVSLDAKLSLRRKSDGTVGLYVHPIYRQPIAHPNLTPEEAAAFAKGGVHAKSTSAYGTIVEYGTAPYQFDKDNKQSFYIRLQKDNGKMTDMWGIDLERALATSKHVIGDKVQLDFLGTEKVTVDIPIRDKHGNTVGSETKMADRHKWEISDYDESRRQEKAVIYEFDTETNSFVSVDEDNVLAPGEINGTGLTEQQIRDFKKGKTVTLQDGTELQASPASENGLRSNKRLLIASMVLDGGISFVLYHAVNALVRIGQKKRQQENEYSKGYLDALNKVQVDLERKQAKYPNDPKIADDLDVVKKEHQRVSLGTPSKQVDDTPAIDEMKSKVNDPELERGAAERIGQEERSAGKTADEPTEQQQPGRMR